MREILGQDRAVEQLQAALAGGHVHHAYVFHGLAGVGKFTTAAAFAKVLLCHKAQTDLTGRVEACGGCESCRLMARAGRDDMKNAAAHPDFHVVNKELALYSEDAQTRGRKLLTIPVEVLRRSLIGPVYRAAQLRHGKVFVVDEAELIDQRNGQNALLKTLEEPPAGTVIILVTASLDRLLTTVRSRCQRVAFSPLADGLVEKWLDKEAPEVTGEDRAWLMHFAGGSLGRAMIAKEYGLTGWARAILPGVDQMAKGKFPAGLGMEMAQAIDGFAAAWVAGHENASKDAANRQGAGLMWAMLARHASRRLAEATGKARGAEGARAAAQPWLGAIDAVARAEGEVASNVNMSIVADHAAAGLFAGMTGKAGEEMGVW